MAPTEARSLALAAARRTGAPEDPLHVEDRNDPTVVVFPDHVAWVAYDEIGKEKLARERRVPRLLSLAWARPALETAK